MIFKNVLITGGCGFIGSNFLKLILKKEKYNIVNIDKLTYASRLVKINYKNYKFYKLDICSYNRLKKIIFQFKPDVIIHFAAETHVDNSIINNSSFVNTNIVGTSNLINISREFISKNKKTSKFKFIHISTDEVFGQLLNKKKTFSETSKYNPRNPYAATKASSDFLIKAYINTYGFPAIILNCSNNFGPFQHTEKLIPKIVKNTILNKKIPIYGKGMNIRDWVYVEDFCEAIFKIMLKGKVGETFNVGANNEISNLELAKMIIQKIGKKTNVKIKPSSRIKFVKDRLGHDFRYAINSKKLRKFVKWKPQNSLDKGLSKTIDYFLNLYENEK